MRLKFLGTRGEIEARTKRHWMHSSLQVASNEYVVMIDCGIDWLGHLTRLRPDAIFLTHAHADHAGGLKDGAPCRVFATADTWDKLKGFAVRNRSMIRPRKAIE